MLLQDEKLVTRQLGLSVQQLDFFKRNGFLHIKQFVDFSTVQTFLSAI